MWYKCCWCLTWKPYGFGNVFIYTKQRVEEILYYYFSIMLDSFAQNYVGIMWTAPTISRNNRYYFDC